LTTVTIPPTLTNLREIGCAKTKIPYSTIEEWEKRGIKVDNVVHDDY